MTCCAEKEFCAHARMQFLPKCTGETAITIENYGEWHTFVTEDVVVKNMGSTFRSERIVCITRVLTVAVLVWLAAAAVVRVAKVRAQEAGLASSEVPDVTRKHLLRDENLAQNTCAP